MSKFIHQSTVVYLACIMLVRMMAMPISLLDYSINQRYIAGNLCENRMNVAMHCGGRCYLNKQLARSNDSQESRNQSAIVKTLIIDFYEPLSEPAFHCASIPATRRNYYRVPGITAAFAGNIFHPPIA